MIDKLPFIIIYKIASFLNDKSIINLRTLSKSLNLYLKGYKLNDYYTFKRFKSLTDLSYNLYNEPDEIYKIQYITDNDITNNFQKPKNFLYSLKKNKTIKLINIFISTKNKDILLNLPYNLESLILKRYYNNLVPERCELKYLPKTLKYLELDFNVLIDNLPNKLEELKLGYHFNQPINNLPPNLKKLTFDFGSSFIQNLDNLPTNLECLDLGDDNDFNNNLDHLPQTLTILKTGSKFNQKLDYLPINLKVLEVGRSFNQILNNLPKKLEILIIYGIDGEYGIYNQPIYNLPENLKELIIESSNFNQPINNLPLNLEILTIYSEFLNQSLDYLPNSLKELRLFSKILNQPIDKLPQNLKILDITSELFNQSLNNIPKNLEKLFIRSDSLNQKIKSKLATFYHIESKHMPYVNYLFN